MGHGWLHIRNTSELDPIRIPREGGGFYELPGRAMGEVGTWAERAKRVTDVTLFEDDTATPPR